MDAQAALNKLIFVLMEAKSLPMSVNEINELVRTISKELEKDG